MRVLSVRQPWADLIVDGQKDVENRSWSTSYRGPVLIHAGMARPHADDVAEAYGLAGIRPVADWEGGAIVGVVELVDCIRGARSRWAQADAWHWVLARPRRLRPRDLRGRLGLWEPSAALICEIDAELRGQKVAV